LQAHVVVRHKLTLPSDTEYLLVTLSSPSLQTCLVESESSPQVCIDILHSTITVLRKVVAASTKVEDLPLTSANFALEILSLGTQWSANNNLDSAISGSLSVLELIASTQRGRKHMWEDPRWQKGMKWALSSAVSDTTEHPPRDPSPVSYAALSSLKQFAGDSSYSRRFIDEGFHLSLLLLVVPSPDSKPQLTAKSTLPISAADVLGSFVRAEGAQCSSLSNLIPRSLLSCLKNDEDLGKFISMAGSEIQNPTTVWTDAMRGELRKRALEQITKQKDLASEDEAQWLQSFEYACLRSEFVIGGVFVNHLASGKWGGADLPDDTVFLDLMMEYLERERDVVSVTEVDNETEGYEDKHVIFSEGVQEQRGQAAELEKYVLVLAAIKECLIYAACHARNDLTKALSLQTFLEIASMEQCAPKVWTEIMLIFKVLALDETSQNFILQSNLLGLAGVYLWDVITEDKGEVALLATLDMLHFLSENITASVEATNYFSSSGVLFPLLCLFCDADLPSLRTGIMETERVTPHQRLIAACILGQLLLCSSGVTSRVSFLGENSTVRKDPFSESKIHRITTDIDELMNLLEPGYSGTTPLVFRTLMSLLPLELLSTLAHNPSQACELYNATVYLPRLVWDDDTRRSVKQLLTEEAIKLQGFVKTQLVAGLGSWAIELEQPVFTRWVLATVLSNDNRPEYRNTKEDAQYVPELYLGGFFLDQFLRIPEFFFGKTLEQRFLREVKKAVVLGIYADDPDSLRRLVLSLLLLFKGRPYLLAGRSYIDIFLAVSRNICSTGAEARMLAQPVIILIHSIANHKDIVDIIVSEDLIHSLVDFLELDVPKADAGFAGTDPRLCSLMLLLRLIRLSPRTVEITATVSVVQKLADTVLDMEGDNEVSKIALECLALMCNDKRRGKEVIRLLDSLAPAATKGFWDIPVENIWDDAADFEILQHFLQHRYPCAWWTSDKSNETLHNGVSSAPSASTNLKEDKIVADEDQEIFNSTVSRKWDAQFSQDHSS
jgi:DnaJ family protein C protein 13